MPRTTPPAAIAITAALALGWPAQAASPAPAPHRQGDDLGSALGQPLDDLNLSRAKIPAVLLAAAKAPYAPLEGCPAIIEEVAALDAALGADLDQPETAPGTRAAAGQAALDLVRGAASSWIPFRGVLRRLTGAERRAAAVREAVLAGEVRRAYLKGLGERLECTLPARPRRD